MTSNEISDVTSSAWMNENASFTVWKEAEQSTASGETSLKVSYLQENEPEAKLEKKNSKLRKCKCLLKRVSKVFRRGKE